MTVSVVYNGQVKAGKEKPHPGNFIVRFKRIPLNLMQDIY